MSNRSIPFLFTILCFTTAFGQAKNTGVSIELSIPHSRELAWINDKSSYDKAYLLIHNNSDRTQYFYEDWCSYGYFSLSLEIKHNDSIYRIQRSKKIMFRNFHDYHIVRSGETLVIDFKIVDSVFAANTEYCEAFGNGWVGFPDFSDTVEVRAIYEMQNLNDSIPSENIGRLRYKRDGHTGVDNYVDFIYPDIPEPEVNPKKPKPDPNPSIIFHEPLVSEWQRVVLLR